MKKLMRLVKKKVTINLNSIQSTKMKTRIFSAVLSAFILATASVGATAYVEETTASSVADTVEVATEKSDTTESQIPITLLICGTISMSSVF